MSDNSLFDPRDRATSSRHFLRDGGLAAVIAGVATACKPETAKAPAVARPGTPAGQTGGTMGPHDTASGAAASAAETVDATHEKGIKAFPARTAGIGETFTYEFVVPNDGSHRYRSHHNAAKQVGLGLLGASIVDPRQKGKFDAPDVDTVAPGERGDVVVNCTNPGTWAFHCHILSHAESDHRSFGMVTAPVIQA